MDWVAELASVRILDPACGSGNFLYLALRRMLDLWQEARIFAAQHDLPTFTERQVHPSQLYGLETNIYAQELASVVVWIGYLQWLNQNGIGWPTEPILRKLDNIQHRDAILTHAKADDEVFELDWRDLGVLNVAAALDWSQVEPAIFGTLFERSLDPGKRSQLGQHYTSKDDILLIVEPVVMEPLQRRWQMVKAEATAKAEAAEKAKGREYAKLRADLQETSSFARRPRKPASPKK